MAEIPNIDPTDFDVLEEKPSEKELLFLMACGMSLVEVENINYSKGKAEEIARDVYEFAIDLEDKMTAAMEEARKKGIEALENGETDAIINEKIRDAFRQTGIDFIKQNQTALRLFLEPKTRTVLTNFFMFEPPERLKRLEGFLEDFAALLLQWIPDQENELRLHVDFDEATRDRFAELILDSPFFVLNRSVLSGKIKDPKKTRPKTAQAKNEQLLQDEASVIAGTKGVEKILSADRIYPMDALWVCQIDIDDIAGRVPKHEIESVRQAQLRAIDILLWINTGASRFIRGLDIPTIKFWVENREAALADVDSLAWERLKEIYGSVMKMPGVLKSAYKKAEVAKSSSVSEKSKPVKTRAKKTKKRVKEVIVVRARKASPAAQSPRQKQVESAKTIGLPDVDTSALKERIKQGIFAGQIANWKTYPTSTTLSVIINDETYPLIVEPNGDFSLTPVPAALTENASNGGQYNNSIIFAVEYPEGEETKRVEAAAFPYLNTAAKFGVRKSSESAPAPTKKPAAAPAPFVPEKDPKADAREDFLLRLLEFENYEDLIERIEFGNGGICQLFVDEEAVKLFSLPEAIVLRFSAESTEIVTPDLGRVNFDDPDEKAIFGELQTYIIKNKIKTEADEKEVASRNTWREENPELTAEILRLRYLSSRVSLDEYRLNGKGFHTWDLCRQPRFKGKVEAEITRFAQLGVDIDMPTDGQRGLLSIDINFQGKRASLKPHLDRRPEFDIIFRDEALNAAWQRRLRDFLVGFLCLVGQRCHEKSVLTEGESRLKSPETEKNGDKASFTLAINRFNRKRGRVLSTDENGKKKALRGQTWGDLAETGEALVTEAYIQESPRKNLSSKQEYELIRQDEKWKKYIIIRLWKSLGIHTAKHFRYGAGPIRTESKMWKVFETRVRPLFSNEDWQRFLAIDSPTAAVEFELASGQSFVNMLIDLWEESDIPIVVKPQPKTAEFLELVEFARNNQIEIFCRPEEASLFAEEIELNAVRDRPLKVTVMTD